MRQDSSAGSRASPRAGRAGRWRGVEGTYGSLSHELEVVTWSGLCAAWAVEGTPTGWRVGTSNIWPGQVGMIQSERSNWRPLKATKGMSHGLDLPADGFRGGPRNDSKRCPTSGFLGIHPLPVVHSQDSGSSLSNQVMVQVAWAPALQTCQFA